MIGLCYWYNSRLILNDSARTLHQPAVCRSTNSYYVHFWQFVLVYMETEVVKLNYSSCMQWTTVTRLRMTIAALCECLVAYRPIPGRYIYRLINELDLSLSHLTTLPSLIINSQYKETYMLTSSNICDRLSVTTMCWHPINQPITIIAFISILSHLHKQTKKQTAAWDWPHWDLSLGY